MHNPPSSSQNMQVHTRGAGGDSKAPSNPIKRDRTGDEASHDPRANGAAGPNSAAPPLALSEAGEDDIGEGRGGQAQNVHEKATCAVGLQTFACDRPILLLLHGQGHGGVAAPPCQRRARACAWWASSTTCLRKGMSSSSMMRSWFTKGMIAEIKACSEANITNEANIHRELLRNPLLVKRLPHSPTPPLRCIPSRCLMASSLAGAARRE